MTVEPVEQQRFAEKYAVMTEMRKELIRHRVHEETLNHLKSERFIDLPGYPSDDGALEMRVATIEKALHKFFTAENDDSDDEQIKQDIDNLRHRLSMADDETAASLERIEQIRRALQSLEEHPELVKTENELAPLMRQRDKLNAKLEAGQSRNPEADFRRPFSASHFQLE
jgi:hypothetical protein